MGPIDDNSVPISLARLLKALGKGCRGLRGVAVRATDIYVSKGAVGRSGIARIGSTSTGGDGWGPFYMPRR